MSRRRWSALALLTLWATTVSAGELTFRYWPVHCVPMELTRIDVLLDVGYWVDVFAPNAIKLYQVHTRTYEGYANLKLRCNFNLSMSSTITPTGQVPGRYSCWIEGDEIDPPGGTARVCVRLDDADVTRQLGGSKDIHVATVTIQITPRV